MADEIYPIKREWGKQKPALGTPLVMGNRLSSILRASWVFNERTGNSFFDSSVNQYEATNTSGVWIPEGVEFDNNRYAVIGSMGWSQAVGQPISIVARVRATGLDSAYSRVVLGNRSGAELFKLQNKAAGDIWSFEFDPVGNGGSADGNAAVLNEWIDLAGIYDGTDIILYEDGIETARIANKPSAQIQADDFVISREESGVADEYLHGDIEFIHVFFDTIYPSEVASICANPYQMWDQTQYIWADVDDDGPTEEAIAGSLPAMNGVLTRKVNYHRSVGGAI